MAKKKLKIEFTVNTDSPEFDTLNEMDISTSGFYEKTKTYLKDLTGIAAFETDPTVSFKSVDQDVEEPV